MDVLVGKAPAGPARLPGARGARALPRRVDALLADGTRLEATVDDAEAGLDLPEAVFDPPPHAGYRARRRRRGPAPPGRTLTWRVRERFGSGRFAKVNLGLEVLGAARRRLPRAAHALPDDRPPRRRRPAAPAPGRRGALRPSRSCPPTGRTWPRGPPRPCARYGRVRGRRRDRDHEAHPGRRGARAAARATPRPSCWASTACGSSGSGPTGSTRWPAAWAPTCPTSCSGAPPSASPGATRSTPCAARSGPTSWSWTPGVHVSTARVFAARGRSIDTP